MKLSTKGRYGLRAMVELAALGSAEPVALKTIAKRQDISEYYLEQLFAMLRKDGLIAATRGAQGGYTLNKPPEDISVGDVLRALEGSLWHVECMDEPCESADFCPSHALFLRIQESIDNVVNTTTLKDMLEDYLDKQERRRNP